MQPKVPTPTDSAAAATPMGAMGTHVYPAPEAATHSNNLSRNEISYTRYPAVKSRASRGHAARI